MCLHFLSVKELGSNELYSWLGLPVFMLYQVDTMSWLASVCPETDITAEELVWEDALFILLRNKALLSLAGVAPGRHQL